MSRNCIKTDSAPTQSQCVVATLKTLPLPLSPPLASRSSITRVLHISPRLAKVPNREPAMEPPIDPYLTEPDLTVLHNLLHDSEAASAVEGKEQKSTQCLTNHDDKSTVDKLASFKNEPVVFCTWDYKDLPLGKGLTGSLLKDYIAWAQTVVRHPVDVIFLTHILLYMCTSVPSAIYLFYRFSWAHGPLHFIMQAYYAGSFTLMLHNCIHQNGLLSRQYALLDRIWPYVLEPLMGHTWDSYYYHHVKHHHVENNGPDDLSSTIRYQRDELSHFLMYVGRFLAFVWLELPLYFFRKRKPTLAVKAALSEFTSYAFLYTMARYDFRATLFVFILPFCMMRIGLMVGNYGQHALVDDVDPKSDFRSSITLIDVPVRSPCSTLSSRSQILNP